MSLDVNIDTILGYEVYDFQLERLRSGYDDESEDYEDDADYEVDDEDEDYLDPEKYEALFNEFCEIEGITGLSLIIAQDAIVSAGELGEPTYAVGLTRTHNKRTNGEISEEEKNALRKIASKLGESGDYYFVVLESYFD